MSNRSDVAPPGGGFVDEPRVRRVKRSLISFEGALALRGVARRRDETGFSFEIPVQDDPVLEALVRRIEAAVGLENAFGGTLRFRRYVAGESHPPHVDNYVTPDGLSLFASALLYLTECEEGGETRFPSLALSGEGAGLSWTRTGALVPAATSPSADWTGCSPSTWPRGRCGPTRRP